MLFIMVLCYSYWCHGINIGAIVFINSAMDVRDEDGKHLGRASMVGVPDDRPVQHVPQAGGAWGRERSRVIITAGTRCLDI